MRGTQGRRKSLGAFSDVQKKWLRGHPAVHEENSAMGERRATRRHCFGGGRKKTEKREAKDRGCWEWGVSRIKGTFKRPGSGNSPRAAKELKEKK